jgi:AraC-like DNA-binding protein
MNHSSVPIWGPWIRPGNRRFEALGYGTVSVITGVKQQFAGEWLSRTSSLSGCLRSTDVIEREAVGALGLRFRQVSAGPFESELRFVRTDHLVAHRERSLPKFQMEGATSRDFFTFAAVLRGQPAGRWSGQPLDPRQMGMAAPRAIMAHPEVVLPLADEFEVHASALCGSRTLDLAPRSLDGFASQLASLIDHPDLCQPRQDRATSRRIERCMLRALFAAIRSSERAPLSPPGSRSLRLRALRRALDFIHESSERVRIDGLATEAGVSQRTLEYAFREALDVTPVGYLRLHRLDGARRELSAADPTETSATTIAARWDFTELGRFSVVYKKLFGEPPSETLRARRRTRTSDTRQLATLRSRPGSGPRTLRPSPPASCCSGGR